MMTKQHRDGRTTLIEVLLVIMILGILATVVAVSLPDGILERDGHTCAAAADNPFRAQFSPDECR